MDTDSVWGFATLLNQIKSGLPYKLYKYRSCSKRNISCLKNNKLWFSAREQLNDPYEGRFAFNDDEIIKSLFGNTVLPENIKKEILTLIKDRVLAYRDQYRICCFSADPTQTLMWSQYAEDHKGFCMEFQVLKDPHLFAPLIPIIYEQEMVKTDSNNVFSHLFQRKSNDWKHEKEIRIIGQQKYQRYIPESLSAIIFGDKTSDADIYSIREILGNRVKYKKLKLGTDSFNNQIIDLSL